MSLGAETLDPVPQGEHRVGVWDRSGVLQCGTKWWGKVGVAGLPPGAGGHERCPADWATRGLSCRY